MMGRRSSKFKQRSFQTSGDLWEVGFGCGLREVEGWWERWKEATENVWKRLEILRNNLEAKSLERIERDAAKITGATVTF